MKDFDLKKECEIEEFDYDGCWDEEESLDVKKKVDGFSKGSPRSGLKGKYLKKKGRVGRKQLKNSWAKGKVDI
ncbi:hypothetical protein HOE04_02325 [archaeon]|nr:hypothetical protein [archaeon]